MQPRKKRLAKSHLYAIVDKAALAGALAGIADIIQLRDKQSKKSDILKNAFLIRRLLSGTKTLFIVNDSPVIARACDSDGVHLGQGDGTVARARKILGRDKLIGVSCHNLRQAIAAQKAGADYIAIGPIFSTPTKPKTKALGLAIINKLKERIKIPFFAIGGINLKNLQKVLSAGAERIAVIRAVSAASNPARAARKLLKALKQK